MSPDPISKASPIVIVGAGVFGLSTAIHLAKRGYTNVKLLDKQPYHDSKYSYDKGYINKIIRAAYGSQVEYQELATDAIASWESWNEEIKSGKTLPPALLGSPPKTDCSSTTRDTIANMTKVGLRETQVVWNNPDDVDRATKQGFGFAVNPFNRKNNFGVLDTQGGFVYADRACCFALHQAKALGVNLILGGMKGTFSNFLGEANSHITGVRTADGVSHCAELMIMACGGWTPTLVPQLDNVCETTAGGVCIFQLPPDSTLWDRFAPENFPTWTYDMRNGESGGLYGFARDSHGAVKIGYRGTKFTNPQTQADGTARSIPITRWTQQSTRQLPLTAARVIKNFVQDFLPELIPCATKTRLCWYTDSFDNNFVLDFVPGVRGLMVATGGSGHGFKFLPTLGAHIVDRIEGNQNPYLHFWDWRSLRSGMKPYNNIMEGVDSERSLHRQGLTKHDSLKELRSSL
ncbi:hypothetical protein FE257_010429 [Aspergillus nanangensis]|uniref:FAD dependent oxidoreductase domain-containing protein n=1 Tax=Aspergillus nanangensis TaxID=2582783 RepID=A0AAD4CIL9_ASPNN|nr:hypothetical protein FE257_010429 [Aspergillus nanangensis]